MPMTKSEVASALAERVGITKKQVQQFFEAQAELAYEQAKQQFVIPGLGKMKVTETAARDMVVPFGSHKGSVRRIDKKTKLKFLISRDAKRAILGS